MKGHNKLWIRFFLMAVYATMYVRDHNRPEFHKAAQLDPTEYDYKVFNICSEITKQVFPFTLDTDNPKLRAGFERLRVLNDRMKGAGRIKKAALTLAAAATFARLYLLPTISNEIPETSRMQPAW